jgi:hypothetical protein
VSAVGVGDLAQHREWLAQLRHVPLAEVCGPFGLYPRDSCRREGLDLGERVVVDDRLVDGVVGVDPLSGGVPADLRLVAHRDVVDVDEDFYLALFVPDLPPENSSIPFSLVHATQFFEFVQSIADAATEGSVVRMAPVLFQPVAGDDVAQVVGRTAVRSPLNGRVEVAGPEQYRMDEFFRTVLADQHPREVVTDEHARYFGTELSERSLVPLGEAILGETRYAEWHGHPRGYPVSRSVS